MPITNAKRLAIVAEARKRNIAADEIAKLEATLDDSSPTAAMFQDMFYAQSESTRLYQQAKQLEADALATKTAAEQQINQLRAWEFQAKQGVAAAEARAAQVAKTAQDSVEAFRTKALNAAANQQPIDLSELRLDPTIATLATQATVGAAPLTGMQQQPPSVVPTVAGGQGGQNGLQQPVATNPAGDVGVVANLLNLPYEHHKLFGSFPDMKFIVEESNRTQEDPMIIWERTYNVGAKRAEIETANFNAKVQAEAERIANEKLAAISVNGQQASGWGDMSKLQGVMDTFASPALRHTGQGNNAADLIPGFANKHNSNQFAQQPQPAAQGQPSAPRTLAMPQTPGNVMSEEAQWAAEFGENLINGQGR